MWSGDLTAQVNGDGSVALLTVTDEHLDRVDLQALDARTPAVRLL
jgi:hypothetical protein